MADTPRTSDRRPKRLFTPARVLAAVLVLLALVFIFQNTRHTKIRLIVPEVTMPLSMALLAMGLIGLIVGWALRSRR